MSKKLIVVTTQLGNDGAERVLSILMNEWAELGVKIRIIQVDPEDYNETYPIADEIKIIDFTSRFNSRSIKRFQKVSFLIKYLNKHSDATVLSFINRPTLLLYLCRPFVKNRIVMSERNDPQNKPPKKWLRDLRDMAFCSADACVFQTHEAMGLFPEKAQKHGSIIINPINPNLPDCWTGEREKIIVNASRLTPQKNLPMLVKAFAKFHESYPEYKLLIYGQGEDEQMVKELIHSLGIDNSAKLMGFSTDIHNDIKKASMYVCSSDYEGIPNSVLEAMALGIPTISTDCPVGGAREVINGNNGLLVPVGDIDKLAEAMKSIAGDSDLAKQLADNGYQIREAYPINKIAKEWLKVLFPN